MNKARMIFSVLVLSLLFSCSMPHHGTEGGSGLLPLQLTEMHDGMNSLFNPAEYSIVFSVPETPSDYGLGETERGWASFEEADYGYFSLDGNSIPIGDRKTPHSQAYDGMLLLDRIFSCPASPSDVQLQRKTRAGENLAWNVFEEG